MSYDIGPKIGIDGEAEFRSQLRQVSQQIKTLGSEMGAVTAQFARNEDSQKSLTAKSKVLTQQIEAQKEKLKLQQEGLAQATQKYGEADERTQKWAMAVAQANRDLANMENELKDTNEKLNETGISLDGVAEALKTGLVTAAKAGIAAITAAAAAVTALTKVSLEGYSEYEQLAGGVKTLFGTEAESVEAYADSVGKTVDEVQGEYNSLLTAQTSVFAKADAAYKTAGLSASAYMETVTGFAAAMINSLGGDTVKAAEKADLAITDMSDNANKMGTAMESIQNAYQGFAKQNYTMLDNLKLGYGGTKEEMQRLLEDAGKLSGVEYDISSFADIVDAIHAIQTEMGITGTTAEEAATTIQGSANAMKGAWENLTTGIAVDGADISTLVDNLVDSVITFGDNVIPRIRTILGGIGDLVTELAPIIAERLPGMVAEIVPSLVNAVASLTATLVQAIPSMISELAGAAAKAVDAVMAADIAGPIVEGLSGLGTLLAENLPDMAEAALTMVANLASAVRENAGKLVDGGLAMVQGLAQGLADSIPVLIEKVPGIVSNIAGVINDNAPKLLAAAANIIGTLANGMIEAIPTLIANIPQILKAIWDVFTAFQWLDLGKNIMQSVGKGINSMSAFIREQAKAIGDDLIGYFKGLPAALKEIGKNLIDGLISGLTSKFEEIAGSITGIASKITGLFTSAWDVHSPSKVFMTIGEFLMAGLELGMENGKGSVMETVDDIANEVTDRFRNLTDALNAKSDISNLQYQLWEMTAGKNANDLEKYDKQLELLTAQELDQAGVVEAAKTVYQAMADQYGANSAEALSYMKTLLQEQIQYQELADSIQEVIDKQRELSGSVNISGSYADLAGTMQSGYGLDSSLDRATANMVNGMSTVMSGTTEYIGTTVLAIDGREFARVTQPYYRSEDKSNPEVVSDI